MLCSLVRRGKGHGRQHVMLARVHQRRQLGPARAALIGDLAPGLAGGREIGLQEGLAQRRRHHRVLALGNVGQGASQPMHDPNTIDAVRVTVCLPFAGAGPAQRRDARFPRA